VNRENYALSSNQRRNDSRRGGFSSRRLGPPTSRTTSFELSIQMDDSRSMWSRKGTWESRLHIGGPGRVWARGRIRDFLHGPVLVLLACRVHWSLGTVLTQRDTCRDLDKGQNRTTTITLIQTQFWYCCIHDILILELKDFLYLNTHTVSCPIRVMCP